MGPPIPPDINAWLEQRGLKRKVLLRTHLSPGDILMLTAAVRDLHLAYPDRFLTDVDTSVGEIWENNPNITKLRWSKKDGKIIKADPEIEIVDCHYNGQGIVASVDRCANGAYHFVHAYAQWIELHLGVRIPITQMNGAIYLSAQEKKWMNQLEEKGDKRRFWIMVAGGKKDYTCKIWDHDRYQAVVDHFKDRLLFVQCGEVHHVHKPLNNVVSLLGKTSIRQFIRLMYHADGVVCPVTFAMHLAAAVETKPERPKRACVVIAGNREPPHWEAYSSHRYLHSMGSLKCCAQRACWKSRVVPLGDGDKKDESLCEMPVQLASGQSIPKCLDMITVQDVIRAIESYLEGNTHV